MADLAPFPMLIKTLSGLEDVLAKELKELGLKKIKPAKRAVHCEGSIRDMYAINLHARTAIRVLKPIHQFRARNEFQLYKGIQQIDWRTYMKVSGTLAVDAVLSTSLFRNSYYVALKTKDAIVDQFRQHVGRRPSVDTDKPHLRIHIHIDQGMAHVALDSSGSSLHRRGYRRLQGQAPLNEVLAAGMILLSGWDGKGTFIDPMCGSGSLLMEAGLLAGNRAPGRNRSFGFEKWPDFQEELWKELKTEAEAAIQPITATILGKDLDRKVLRKTRENLSWAGLLDDVEVRSGDFLASSPPTEGGGTLIMNPPYGERLEQDSIEDFYKQIGDTLKQQYHGFKAWILSSNIPAMKRIGLRPDYKHMLFNGSLPCRYYGYRMYKGNRE